MKLSSTHKEMLRGIPTMEYQTENTTIHAFKVGDGKFILHKRAPGKIGPIGGLGLMINYITSEPVSIDQILNFNCPAYEEIEH